MIDAKAITGGAAALALQVEPDAAGQLARFCELLLRWNRTINLVSRRDEERLLPRHLLDSLSASPWLQGECVADLGTGAGLPGLPLAIVNPARRFTLIDRHERRLRFVRQATIELGLSNVEVMQEDIARYRPATLFDTVVSRAVRDPERLWQVAGQMLNAGGRAVLLCGPRAEMPPRIDGAARVEMADVVIPGLERTHRLLAIDRS